MGIISDFINVQKLKKLFAEKKYNDVYDIIVKLHNKNKKDKWLLKWQLASNSIEEKIIKLESEKNYDQCMKVLSTLFDNKYSKDYINDFKKRIYSKGISLLETKDYDHAGRIFEAIIDYEDSVNYLKTCNSELKFENDYSQALIFYNNGNYEQALSILEQNTQNKKAKELIDKCKSKLEIKIEEKNELDNNIELDKNIEQTSKEEKVVEKVKEEKKDNQKKHAELKLITDLIDNKNFNSAINEIKTNPINNDYSLKIIEDRIKNLNYQELDDKLLIDVLNLVVLLKSDLLINKTKEYIYNLVKKNYQKNDKYAESIYLLKSLGNYKSSKEYLVNSRIALTNTTINNFLLQAFDDENTIFTKNDEYYIISMANKKQSNKKVFCVFSLYTEDIDENLYKAFANSLLEKVKKNTPYLLIDSNFYVAPVFLNVPFDSNSFYIYEYTEEGLKSINNRYFVMFKSNFEVQDEDYLMDVAKKTSDLIECVKAYTGELVLYKATLEKIESIRKYIDDSLANNKELKILIQGSARSGKTIIALCLLRYYKQFKFLLMNYYFYNSLRAAFQAKNLTFPSDRIYHHDIHRGHDVGCGINKGDKYTNYSKSFAFSINYVIVDEAQRLSNLISQKYSSFYEKDKLALESKIGIFLGDNYQRINPDYDEGLDSIKNILQRRNRKYYSYEFDSTIGIPINVVRAYRYILTDDESNLDHIDNQQITLYNNAMDFIKDFRSNEDSSKHLSTLTWYSLPSKISMTGVSPLPWDVRDNDKDFFLKKQYINQYVLSTFDVISRDLHCLYLIIPDEITYDKEDGIYSSSGKLRDDFLINHLYVNMTRATKKLVIYTGNDDLFKYLKEKIEIVSKNHFIYDNPQTKIEKENKDKQIIIPQKLNFIKYYSDNSNAEKLHEELMNYGFDGFIHASMYDNIVKILNDNELKSRDNTSGGFVDIADQDVIVRTSDFVKQKVRFYYAPGNPTLYHFNQRNGDLVYLIFDFSLINGYDVYFSNGNAGSQYSKITGVIDEALQFDWERIFSRGRISSYNHNEIVRVRNAELLVNGPVDVEKYLKKIIVKNVNVKNKLTNEFSEYADIIKVDTRYFEV